MGSFFLVVDRTDSLEGYYVLYVIIIKSKIHYDPKSANYEPCSSSRSRSWWAACFAGANCAKRAAAVAGGTAGAASRPACCGCTTG